MVDKLRFGMQLADMYCVGLQLNNNILNYSKFSPNIFLCFIYQLYLNEFTKLVTR